MENSENTYVFDIDKINEFVFSTYDNRTKDVEIIEEFIYDDDGKSHQTRKEVRETKVSDVSGQATRYDLIKYLMDILSTVELDEEGKPADMTLGQVIALNTLDSYGLIVKN